MINFKENSLKIGDGAENYEFATQREINYEFASI